MEKPLHYIDYGTDICSSLAEGLSREWLVTNGIGGYASGTIAGPLSRSYHGLLIAATRPPVSRTLLLSKLDETIYVKDQMYPLYSNLLPEGAVEPDGLDAAAPSQRRPQDARIGVRHQCEDVSVAGLARQQ